MDLCHEIDEKSTDGSCSNTLVDETSAESTAGPFPRQLFGPNDETLDDIVRGLIFATLAITDDDEGTMRRVGKESPWNLQAMRLVAGSSMQVHLPLSVLLREVYGLHLDYRLDARGTTIDGVTLDTQGYIAHNEDYIVLSYGCQKSAFEWLDNFSTKKSVFQPENDLSLEYLPFVCAIERFTCYQEKLQGYAQSEFYNNFLSSMNLVKLYIDPFLQMGRRPRKLFVTGHSLGGGIATIAAAYFMLAYDWHKLPHTLVTVTSGSPRVFSHSMVALLEERMIVLGQAARVYRVVKGNDVVTSVPAVASDFEHIAPPVYISDTGRIISKRLRDESDSLTYTEITQVLSYHDMEAENCSISTFHVSKYEQFVKKIPPSLRDHLPDSYLKPLFEARGIRRGRDINKPRQLTIQGFSETPLESNKRLNQEEHHQNGTAKLRKRIFGCLFRSWKRNSARSKEKHST